MDSQCDTYLPFFFKEQDCDSSSSDGGDGIDALRSKIMEVLRQEPYMGEKIPSR